MKRLKLAIAWTVVVLAMGGAAVGILACSVWAFGWWAPLIAGVYALIVWAFSTAINSTMPDFGDRGKSDA